MGRKIPHVLEHSQEEPKCVWYEKDTISSCKIYPTISSNLKIYIFVHKQRLNKFKNLLAGLYLYCSRLFKISSIQSWAWKRLRMQVLSVVLIQNWVSIKNVSRTLSILIKFSQHFIGNVCIFQHWAAKDKEFPALHRWLPCMVNHSTASLEHCIKQGSSHHSQKLDPQNCSEPKIKILRSTPDRTLVRRWCYYNRTFKAAESLWENTRESKP